MAASLFLLAVACVAPGPLAGPSRLPAPGDSLAVLYQGGRTWKEFMDAARARKGLWQENYERGITDSGLVARARGAGGPWRLLVIAVDSCSDSANTIPFLVRLAEQVPGLEVRIVPPTKGRWVMEGHRTEDGRAATPTVLVLDEEFRERGCFVERPRALRRWLAGPGQSLPEQERHEAKMRWYREDGGRETVLDLVEILEAAAAGGVRCEATGAANQRLPDPGAGPDRGAVGWR